MRGPGDGLPLAKDLTFGDGVEQGQIVLSFPELRSVRRLKDGSLHVSGQRVG